MTNQTFAERCAKAMAIIGGEDEYDFSEEFKKLIDTEMDLKEKTFSEFGSWRTDDHSTPDMLYRMLWLVGPKDVDFSDMYKTELFRFASADGKTIVTVELFKFEFGLYFYAQKDLVNNVNTSGVWAGMPGADNGGRVQDQDVLAFIELVKKAVQNEWMVYGGNDFIV